MSKYTYISRKDTSYSTSLACLLELYETHRGMPTCLYKRSHGLKADSDKQVQKST